MRTHFICSKSILLFISWLWIYLLIPFSINAQDQNNWKIKHIGPENGLSNRFANSIIQDHRGFTWIATNFGLNRYDGHRIDILTRESNRLQTNTIYQLEADIHQNLWVFHRQADPSPITGIDILDPISFQVQPLLEYVGGTLPFKTEDIKSVQADSLSHLYILTEQNEVFRFDQKGMKLLFHVPGPQRIEDIGINSDMITIRTEESNIFLLYDTLGNKLKEIPALKIPSAYQGTPGTWNSIGQLNAGEQAIVFTDVNGHPQYYTTLSSDGFSELKDIPGSMRKTGIANYSIFQKAMWCLADDKVYRLHLLPGEIDSFLTDINYLSRTFYSDAKGLFWSGTEDGVWIFSERPQYFKAYLSDENPMISCRGFTEDLNGDIYIMTYSGTFKFNPETKTFKDWNSQNEILGLTSTTDSNGDLWFVGEGTNLIRYTPLTESVSVWQFPTKVYFAIWTVKEARSGQIVLGTSEGCWIKDKDSHSNPVQFSILNGADILNKSTIYHLLETDEGIWLSTDNGLFLLDLKKGIKAHINEEDDHLPNDNLLFLHIDTAGIFWIASRGGGLIKWDRSDNTFKSYTVNQGLSHNIIYAIFEDDFGFLWMPSDLGLMRFEKSTGTCRTFLRPEGIPHEEFNRASYFKDSHGHFYFGGLNGFIRFNPKDLLETNVISLPVILTKFEAINEKTGEVVDLTYAAASLQSITLNPQVSSFLIHYSMLDYDEPILKRFAYRIDGLNSNWTYVNETFIRINGLKGGEYTIRLKGQSSTGQWSKDELVIPLTIQRPLIARWYSLAVMILIVSGIVYWIVRKRSQLQKAKLEREMAISKQLRQVDKMKDQFLANTSHELRTPLNGMIGLVESMRENSHSETEKEDMDLVIASGRRLSNLVNDILDFSRLKEHDLQLSLKPVDIRTIAEICIRMNRQLVRNKDVVFQNQIPENLIYGLADENRLQQIFQNLVGNAIKFTHAGTIRLDAKQIDKMIVISVSDTGIGIEKEKQDLIFKEFEQSDGSIAREYGGTGLGLSITKYLVELHGGSIHVESTPGKGSVFTFTIPVYDGDTSQVPEKEKTVTGVRHSEEVLVTPKLKITSATNGEDGTRRHILVVDDEPVNLKVLKNHLEHAGYMVTLANDGHEALQLIEHDGPFHLVLLDVMMPRISGYEVCQKIRERYLLTELPVIMVTAKNQINDLVEGLGIGANDYIVKPFSKDELLSRVKTQLDHYHIHEATNRFIPHEFIHSLGRQSIIDLNRGDMVEQNVHVMFSDMRDYTSLAEDMTPQENFRFVNGLAGRVGPIVKKNQGMINQYLGDTIMMLFMYQADDGVQAGIDILRMISDYNLQRNEKQRKPIRLGIGLHSGPLMMGIIGDAVRTDAAVISDTVNTASRMEGLTKFFNVNFILSEDTVLKLSDRDRFNLRYLGKVQAKGKQQTLDIYECFDGDTDEQIVLKKASVSSFHAGMEAYFAKDMNASRKFFDQVYQANPEDTTALGFLHRIHNHLIQGLPVDWSGVEVMVSK